MGTFVSAVNQLNTDNNYAYDAEGRLVKDVQEEIDTIIWRVDGKVKEIRRGLTSNKKNIIFDYDAMGHRIAKHVYNNQTLMLEKSTYLTNCLTFCKKGYTIVDPACSVNETAGLILDAQEESRIFGVKTTGRRTRAVAGRKMSMYDHKVNAEATVYYLAERNIYGSSRLGTTRDTINMYIPNQLPGYGVVGNRNYELNNHLGNVLAVISDIVYPLSEDSSTISSYEVGITQISDYSPFGVQLDGRTMEHGLHEAAAVDTSTVGTPTIAEIYKNEFDVPVATTSPYTGAPTTLDANLSNTEWTSSTGTFTNYSGVSSTKAIAISSASADTAYLTLSMNVASGYALDISSYSFYHRSSTTGYASYLLVVNGVEAGSGTIWVTSGSTFHSTGLVSVLNAITGQTGTVNVVLKLFGGTHGSSGTFRMDDFVLNGYTQQVPSNSGGNSNAYVVSNGYRYGYQGSEMDNEVKDGGNSYTTFFRQLDPRLGRWLTIDPKATAWESPYVSMGNNPIYYNDPMGDTTKFQSSGAENLYKSTKNEINNKINSAKNKISKIDSKIARLESKTKPNTYRIDQLKKLKTEQETTINALENVLTEFEEMEKSTVVFRIRFGESDFHKSTKPGNDAGGNFAYNTATNEMDVNIKETSIDPTTGESLGWLNIQKLAHEMKHGYQFINHQVSFFGKNGGSAYDITDEYEAFERQNLFANSNTNKVMDVQKFVQMHYKTLFNLRPNRIDVIPSNMSTGEKYF